MNGETFNLNAAMQAAREGIDLVASHNGVFLDIARQVAKAIALEQGTVTADDVRRVLYSNGIYPNHYNAWGAVFNKSGFRWTGVWKRSAVVKGHGNLQRVWELSA